MFNGKTQCKWPCLIAFCMFTRPGNPSLIQSLTRVPVAPLSRQVLPRAGSVHRRLAVDRLGTARTEIFGIAHDWVDQVTTHLFCSTDLLGWNGGR